MEIRDGNLWVSCLLLALAVTIPTSGQSPHWPASGPTTTAYDPFGWRGGDRFDEAALYQGGVPCDAGACGEAGPEGWPDEGGLEMLDPGCTVGAPGCRRWSAGVEFTFLKPYFGGNPAFTTLTSNGTTQESFSDTDLSFNTDLAPRVWIEVLNPGSLGMRVRYWQYDDGTDPITGVPADNGFGRISSPAFGEVMLSTTVPGSGYTTVAELNAYNIDIEATHSVDFHSWACMTTAGLRFAEIDQSYSGTLVDEMGTLQGTVDFDHQMHGFGPILGVRVQRPFLPRLSLFGIARGALLFGESESNLFAQEDLDLAETLTTTRTTSQDDLLPMGEVQLGLQWIPISCGVLHPYLHAALEGQLWGNTGNSSSEQGSLGFYGFNIAVGFDW